MCNLYTLAPWEVRHLIQHYRLIGTDFEETMRGRNETLDVYPNRPAPVVIEQDGEFVVRHDMLWGFPPFRLGAGYGTNFRTLKNHLWRPWLDREHRCVVPATAFAEPDRNTSKPRGVALVRTRRQAAVLLCRDLAALDRRSRDKEEAQHRRPRAVFDYDDGAQRRRRANP